MHWCLLSKQPDSQSGSFSFYTKVHDSCIQFIQQTPLATRTIKNTTFWDVTPAPQQRASLNTHAQSLQLIAHIPLLLPDASRQHYYSSKAAMIVSRPMSAILYAAWLFAVLSYATVNFPRRKWKIDMRSTFKTSYGRMMFDFALDTHYNPRLHETYRLNIKHKIRKFASPLSPQK